MPFNELAISRIPVTFDLRAILIAPFTSEFINIPSLDLNKPLFTLFPTYSSWCLISSLSIAEHLEV